MLISTKEMLNVAYQNNFGVGAYNIGNSEFVKAVIEVAEELNAPAILQIHPLEVELLTNDFMTYVKEAAQNAKVPISIHLDHGRDAKDCIQAIRNGYTSVMIDASHLPFEENIRVTKEVVDIAHQVGVSVEAELGTIGSNKGSGETTTAEALYTDPSQAKQFVDETGVDFLAVAIGTIHGIYPKGKKPNIQIDRLQEIRKAVDMPLVLHGGSDNPEEKIQAAVENGIAKVNLSSDMKVAFYTTFKETMIEMPDDYEPWIITPQATEAAKKVLRDKMHLFESVNKASLYV